ncbi:MAG: hypothetical protein ACFFAO_21895, partial [Candidatus Hermodarchaeota archaeon]
YCEIGLTDKENLVSPKFRIKLPPKTSYRKELISILKHFPHLNSISFSGYYGEPTLNDNILDFYKIAYDVRESLNWTQKKPNLTLFTNSSTLHFEEIRERVINFDVVLAKLDVATEDDFQRTNSPHKETPNLEIIIESIRKLKKEMPTNHKLAIQSLIFNSYKTEFIPNNNAENITKLAYAIKRINPDSVQIYSIARIPANYFVFSIDKDRKQVIVEELQKIVNNPKIDIAFY